MTILDALERALEDLKQMKAGGFPLDDDIGTLAQAIKQLTRGDYVNEDLDDDAEEEEN